MAELGAPWPLFGHGPLLAGLWRAARSERLPHALLLQGRAGIGKLRAARALAQGLFCAAGPRAEGPCGACGPCKRFLAESHPDLLVIDPPPEVDEQIRIGYIVRREGPGEPDVHAAGFLALKPLEGGWRIVILRRAERMAPQAQNALLKMLEEPGDAVLWILTCERPAELLATIKSRVVAVRCAALSDADTLAVLRAHGVEPAAAAQLARWSRGSPGAALAMAERGVPALREIAIALLCARTDAFAATAAVAEVAGRFEGKTAAAKERARARTFLDLAGALLGDLARLRAGIAPEKLAHGDLAGRAGLALAARPRLLADAVLGIARARADVELNLDPAAAIERASLLLAARDPARAV